MLSHTEEVIRKEIDLLKMPYNIKNTNNLVKMPEFNKSIMIIITRIISQTIPFFP